MPSYNVRFTIREVKDYTVEALDAADALSKAKGILTVESVRGLEHIGSICIEEVS